MTTPRDTWPNFDDIFAEGYVPPPRPAPTAEEIEAKAEARRARRVLKAFDTNKVMCADCGVTILDMHHATLEAIRNGGAVSIKKCKSPFRDCKAQAASQALHRDPLPRPAKITARKIAAFKKRKKEGASV